MLTDKEWKTFVIKWKNNAELSIYYVNQELINVTFDKEQVIGKAIIGINSTTPSLVKVHNCKIL